MAAKREARQRGEVLLRFSDFRCVSSGRSPPKAVHFGPTCTSCRVLIVASGAFFSGKAAKLEDKPRYRGVILGFRGACACLKPLVDRANASKNLERYAEEMPQGAVSPPRTGTLYVAFGTFNERQNVMSEVHCAVCEKGKTKSVAP